MPEGAIGALVVVIDDAAVESGPVVRYPRGDIRILLTVVAILVGRRYQYAERVVGERAADERGEFRRKFAQAGDCAVGGGRLVHGFCADDAAEAGVVERTCRLDVDGRADTAGRDVHPARLVDLNRPDAFRRDVAEVEGAAALRRHRASVQRDQVELRAHAADGDLRAFIVDALDRHARDSRERLCQVLVGEFADLLGRNRIDDTCCRTLAIHRRHETAANTRRDDFLDDLAVGAFLRHYRRCKGRAERQCNSRGQRCLVERWLVHLNPLKLAALNCVMDRRPHDAAPRSN